jgi:hypothetical protein
MLDLASLQSQIATSLMSGHFGSIAGEIAAPAADPVRRMMIYRNNTLLSLTAALKATFPVTARMSDERFFAFAADSFIRTSPPSEARLETYGKAFPGFLRRFEASRAYPLLAEMAAFELAINETLVAARRPPLSFAAFSESTEYNPRPVLCLQPSLRFAASRWELLNVWMDHKNGRTTDVIERRPSRYAICREGADLQFVRLDPARFVFWRKIAARSPVDSAMIRALARDALFDAVTETLSLFRAGLVVSVHGAAARPDRKDNRND